MKTNRRQDRRSSRTSPSRKTKRGGEAVRGAARPAKPARAAKKGQRKPAKTRPQPPVGEIVPAAAPLARAAKPRRAKELPVRETPQGEARTAQTPAIVPVEPLEAVLVPRAPKHGVAAGGFVTNRELDARLDALAADPDSFEREARKLAAAYDKAGRDLEIVDPQSWRKPLPAPLDGKVQSIETQFRHEVDSIVILERDDEFRLARRVEFARLRLEGAVKAAGLKPVQVEGGAASAPSAFLGQGFECSVHPAVCRRWAELHALRTELVERNLYLVPINVERYAHTSAGRLDLMQEGSAALYRAVDGFDWRRGLLFRTYAVHWLNQAFRSYLYNCTATVRLPVYLQKAQKHVWAAKDRLEEQGRAELEGSVQALAKATGLSESIVETVLDSTRSTTSLDAPLAGTDEGALRERLSAGESDPYRPELEDVSLARGLEAALALLNEREQTVVRMRFGIGLEREYTLSEVAAKLGVSLERVRQIQVRAMGKLRTEELEKVADPYLN